MLFLRRYVTYCARRRRYSQMQGAADLYRALAPVQAVLDTRRQVCPKPPRAAF